MNARAFHHESARFWERIERLKRELPPLPDGAGWYPYCSLANFEHIAALVGPDTDLSALIAGPGADGGPVLDIGCADGDLAFFLESLGTGGPIHALDHAGTNHNGLGGVRALRLALGSQVEILDVNLDAGFQLPARPYATAFCLGLLYHVKNPFHLLEGLSRYARTCFLSTRIMRAFPGGAPVPPFPSAYLLDPDELNGDPTNFWIFNEAGLKRLATRAGWQVERWHTTGNSGGGAAAEQAAPSDPDTLANDERAFLLLRSRRWLANIELGQGWHEESPEGWRWTAARFDFRIPPGGWREASLSFYLPENVWARGEGPVTLTAGERSYTVPGPGDYVWRMPVSGGPGRIEVSTDRWLPPSDADDRELGIVVTEVTLR